MVPIGTVLTGKGGMTMADREKVINDLNVSKLMLCNPKMLTSEMCVRIGQAINGAIDLLKEQEATKWISTAERLPKSNPEDLEYPTVIIALEDGTVELGCFYESTKEWGAGENFDRLRKPVAWMPLPEAP